MPNLKELKRLAAICRKAGIKHYKDEQFEFTLTEEAPVSNYKKLQENKHSVQQNEIETDGLSDHDLMFWSAGNPNPEDTTQDS